MTTTVDEDTQLTPIPNFADIPDEPRAEPWVDGWYAGTFQNQRTFTNKDGNEITFESGDEVSQKGDSRNVVLQTKLTRKDGRDFNGAVRINYRPDVDFTRERIARIAELNATKDAEPTKDETRSRIALGQLKRLQTIAGTTFTRNGNNGLDLTPVFNKGGFFRIADGKPNPTTQKVYKEIVEFSSEPPKQKAVL